ncbi:hypothetical protein BHM03_00020094 [Ensete ventricosum]|nr:hypothetical protein BHM03_00020094 [Ensete ventricosum]
MLATAPVRLRGCRWHRLQQGCGYNRRKTEQRCTRLLRRRAAMVWSERRLLLSRKIVAGSFLPQGSLLAMIKEDGSKRSLLAVLDSERCVMWLKV